MRFSRTVKHGNRKNPKFFRRPCRQPKGYAQSPGPTDREPLSNDKERKRFRQEPPHIRSQPLSLESPMDHPSRCLLYDHTPKMVRPFPPLQLLRSAACKSFLCKGLRLPPWPVVSPRQWAEGEFPTRNCRPRHTFYPPCRLPVFSCYSAYSAPPAPIGRPLRNDQRQPVTLLWPSAACQSGFPSFRRMVACGVQDRPGQDFIVVIGTVVLLFRSWVIDAPACHRG